MPGPLIAAGVGKAAVGKAASAGFGKTLTGSIGAGLGKLASSQFGQSFDKQLAEGSAQSLSGMLQDQGGKLLGIPTDDEKLQRTMNKLYPGTNPWERLGGVGAGVSGTALQARVNRDQQRNQQVLANKNIQKDKEVARIQAQAQVKSAEIAASPKEKLVPSQVQLNEASVSRANEQANAIAKKLAPEIAKLTQERRVLIREMVKLAAEGYIVEAKKKYADALGKQEVRQKEMGWANVLGNVLEEPEYVGETSLEARRTLRWATVVLGVVRAVGGIGASLQSIYKAKTAKHKGNLDELSDNVNKSIQRKVRKTGMQPRRKRQ